MTRSNRSILEQLLAKGVRIPSPEGVEIGPEVDPSRISGDGVVLHAGAKLYGARTLIMRGTVIGREAPATLEDCLVGEDVELGGGYFKGSCFMDRTRMGSGAQVREGCLLEEGSRGAHCVGLKQTILFPFVTLGSLINFCDCLMAGGTDEKNHSEVGSSFVHFNYTPHRDKAAPSLIGDVPRGVMLNQQPVFLGGQGGLVGPVRVGYGVVTAAGTVARKDLLKENTMVLGRPPKSRTLPFHPGMYTNVKRIITLNTLYIGQLIALRRWFLDVRFRFAGTKDGETILKGAVEILENAVRERVRRLGEVAVRMPESIEKYRKVTSGRAPGQTIALEQELFERWPELDQVFKTALEKAGDPAQREAFLRRLDPTVGEGKDYVSTIRSLSPEAASKGTRWLQGLVDEVTAEAYERIPSFNKEV